MADLVTLGEVMIGLSPPNRQRLEQARSLQIRLAGGEYNVAAGFSRLGGSSIFVSRLPQNPLGRMTALKCREHGVDASRIVSSPDERMGLFFIEHGAAPRATSVLYDRRSSAFSRARPGDFDWPAIFHGARWFHLTGITPALSESAKQCAWAALNAAREAGVSISIDINYRAALWSKVDARRCMTPMIEGAELFFTSLDETRSILRIDGDEEEAAERLMDSLSVGMVLFTRRETHSSQRHIWSACAYTREGVHRSREYDLEVVDRIGGGDAFIAGFLFGQLNYDAPRALDLGAAFCALKHTTPGDLNWATLEETQRLAFESGSLRIDR
ncbi:MAG: sugar kinase [bacterium]|nr:sugar kinase [bacterium]